MSNIRDSSYYNNYRRISFINIDLKIISKNSYQKNFQIIETYIFKNDKIEKILMEYGVDVNKENK